MRILHTSDWHLGKRIEGRERLPEQRAVLLEIAEIARKYMVDLVLVAGDVYDVYTPPADAENAFFEGIERLGEICPVVVVSGNHDDAKRLAAARVLAEKKEIYLVGDNKTVFSLPPAPAFDTRLVRSGEGYAVFQKGEEKVWLGMLPYPTESRFHEAEDEEKEDVEKIADWIAACFRDNAQHLPQILVSHLYVAGSSVGKSERDISLGGARAVSKEMFPDCAYVALGHVHKKQKISESKHAWYSGSILQYSFDDVPEKSVQIFDLVGGEAQNVTSVPLTSGKKLVSLESNSVVAANTLLDRYADCYVDLLLRLAHPLSAEEHRAFVSAHPQLVSFRLAIAATETQKTVQNRSQLSNEQLFCDYYKKHTGSDVPQDLLQLFLRLMEGGEDETR